MSDQEKLVELLQCFDEEGNKTVEKTRGEVYAPPLQYWFGIVGVWLVNSKGEILCTKRAEDFSDKSGKWQTCVGGHVKAGMDFMSTAVSEVWEEVGLNIDSDKLFFIDRFKKISPMKRFVEGYAYPFNGGPDNLTFNDGEVVEAKWLSMECYMADKQKNPEMWCNELSEQNQGKIKRWVRSWKQTEILGVSIFNTSREKALIKIKEFLNSSGQYKIFTPNPEMIVKAQKDEYFKNVLNSGDLNLCDGFGLQIVSGVKRIPGVDFMTDVCKVATEQNKGVYLLGSGNDEVVRNACNNLYKQFPGLQISGYNKGPELREGSLDTFDEVIFEQINKSGAQILFVAFGMGKQEKWIYKNLVKMPNIKVAMGVGGSFDFLSGHIRRAPLFLRKLGLEWFYRLIQEPKRIGRIFNATFRFIYYYVRYQNRY